MKERRLTSVEAENIANSTERTFALAVLLKRLIVIHQPKTIKTPKGSTQPDFLVKNPQKPKSKGIYVEVGRGIKKNPHKKRQARVMAEAGLPYVQLNGQHIEKIAAANDLEED